MEVFYINGALAGLGYAVAALIAKRALQQGCGILRLSFIVNLVFVACFSLVLLRHEGPAEWGNWLYPVGTGILFFLGQIFTFTAIRVGDVSLQTPVMGTKAVFVVLIALLLGTETVTLPIGLAAVCSMLAVALLGFSGGGAKRVGLTLTYALLSSAFFAGSDVMVGAYGQAFGSVPMYLFLAILTNGVLSLLLIPFFNGSLREVPAKAWPWAIAAGVGMAGQALLINYTIAVYQKVAATNIMYSSRGLWTVVLTAIIYKKASENRSPSHIFYLRLAGALIMCVAIAIVYIPSK